MRDDAPARAERDLLRSLAHRDLGLPFFVFLPAIHGLFHGAFEGHGSCIEVAVSAEKRRHRPGCSQTRSELDQIPIVSIVAVGVNASCNARMRAMYASSPATPVRG
jgi:hypothetical protein